MFRQNKFAVNFAKMIFAKRKLRFRSCPQLTHEEAEDAADHPDERDLGDLLLRDELGRVRLLDVNVQLDQVLLCVLVDLLGELFA